MEILFENKYTRDETWAKDIYRYMFFRRPFVIFLYGLFALSSIIVIYNSIMYRDFSDLWYLAVPLLWFAMVVFAYKKNVEVTLKRDIELHGKPIEVTVAVTDEGIAQSQSTGSEYKLIYCDVKMAVQTKGYIYLWSKTNLLYSFKKGSFSVGKDEDFLAFLVDKGIRVK